MTMRRLIYLSDATSPPTWSTLEQITRGAQRNNRQLEITGLLIYSSGHFIQMLEGPPGTVGRLYDKISVDPRHRDLETLLDQHDCERLVADWSMAMLNLERADQVQRDRFRTLVDDVRNADEADGASRELAVRLLKEFRQQLPDAAAAPEA
jgi:hypothetical protein